MRDKFEACADYGWRGDDDLLSHQTTTRCVGEKIALENSRRLLLKKAAHDL